MYDNIGRKLKDLAQIFTALGIIASIIFGIFMFVGSQIFLGLLVIALGSLLSWISSLFLYGFGELIEKNCEIARNTDIIVKSLESKNAIEQVQVAENQQDTTSTHKWLCNNCKKLRTKSPCEYCGKE